MESLEDRLLLDGSNPWKPTAADLVAIRTGPLAKEGTYLYGVNQVFQQTGGNMATVADQFPLLTFNGDRVAVEVKGVGNFQQLTDTLKNLGMEVVSSSADYALITGWFPVARLTELAAVPQAVSATPTFRPRTYFQGQANNQAETSMNAPTARATYGVDGTGVTVGVISDSVNRFAGGLQDSYNTGDLPASRPVNIIQDGQPGDSDEGRAMLENIHDIAPGASLAFATGFDPVNSQLTFANNVRRLAAAGASVIVDDLGFASDPFFQDGIISQAIHQVVTQQNVTYVAAAGNEGAGNGYLAPFQGVQTSVTGVGAGRFMNFGGRTALLPVHVGPGGATVAFQYDQPYFTQQPAGSTADVTSNLDIFVLNASGTIVSAGGTDNNLQTHAPFEFISIPDPGAAGADYFVAIQVVSGSDPGYIQFLRFSQGTNTFQVSQNFGGPGVYYGSSPGHNAAPDTIGVGAVSWWAGPGYLNSNPLNNDVFSSSGPSLQTRNADGTPKTPQLNQNPFVTGADVGNTSFFGSIIDTTQSYPSLGQPTTPTNLSQNLPSFSGTSSASPNVAAVVALLKQKQPSLTPAQARSALQSGARPMNGAAPGTWNQHGGYGLVDAASALASIDVLRVINTTPGNFATVTQTPTQLIFSFNKPVDLSTISAADLIFTAYPGTLATVPAVGQPIGLDDPTSPTQVAFPISWKVGPNLSGNGGFVYTLQGNILSTDGKTLQAFTGRFDVADQAAPRVANTTVQGRVFKVTFTEPMSVDTINRSTVYVVRGPSPFVGTILNNDPRATVSYDPTTNSAILDYSGLNQSQLPSDRYWLIVLAGNQIAPGIYQPGVTDLAGNKLDGQFYPTKITFPSGDGDPATPTNPSGRSPDENFYQDLGLRILTPPRITSLSLVPANDSGILGDANTNINNPTFIGQVGSNFPGTLSGLTILAQFSSLHGGNLSLSSPGRGWTGSYDVLVTTDANGTFRINAPFLPEGFSTVRLVVVAQAENPPEPGLSSQFDHNFRVDRTAPKVVGTSLTPGGNLLPANTALNSLTTLSLNVQDPNNPGFGPLATPVQVYFPAIDPTTASNISNYSLINLDVTDPTQQDYSRFIATAKFVATGSDYLSAPNRTSTGAPYYGRIDLTFTQGLPKGRYVFTAHTRGGKYSGITDAAANVLSNDYTVNFNIQPEPVFVVSVTGNASNSQGNPLVPYSFYEVNPRPGDLVSAPPTEFYLDFSNPLDPATVTNDSVQLVGTIDAGGLRSDGDFGTLGLAGLGTSESGTGGYTRVGGTTVSLGNGAYGPNTRLTVRLTGGALAPDHYRLYLPNTGTTQMKDIYGNVLDGEFLGNATGSATDLNNNPAYEDLLPTGQYRQGMSGDSVAGGAFMAGFLVVPSGNVIYAQPDYVEDPLNPATASNGTISRPYSVLAPQASSDPNQLPGPAKATYNNGDPNGGANDASNFLTGFNPVFDRAGIKRFARSAFYAAQQLSRNGPVVIVALPGTSQINPITGQTTQKTFVLQAPSGSDPVINDGSGSVPYNTLLAFDGGSSLKLRNASLYVQNQGSALQAIGGLNPNDAVTFTSYADDTVGGDTNGDSANTSARAGDWGGIVFRSYTQNGRTSTFPVDITLKGPNNGAALSGQDDALSRLNFATLTYAGGAVPATSGVRYDAVTLYNSRPAITNTAINGKLVSAASGGGSQAAISGDLDSFREDDLARGVLVRRTTTAETSITGIWVRPLLSTGQVQSTNSVAYPDNPVTLGGAQNYTFDDPLPYVFTSTMYLGQENLTGQFGTTVNVRDRLYIQPGMMLKFEPGSGLQVQTLGASLIVGDRTYISRWDAQAALVVDPITGVALPTSSYAPLLLNGQPNPDFKPNTVGDAQVLFTTALDNAATTQYVDPITGQATTIVAANDALNTGGIGQPAPGNVPAASRWGYISVRSGSMGILDESTIRYAGGSLNSPGGTVGDAGALNFTGTQVFSFFGSPSTYGTRFIITNNNFTDNADVPMSITPDGLYAADTIRPLASGHPYFRGNLFQRNNGANGLYVKGTGPGQRQTANVNVNSLWDATDLTYIVRETIVMGGRGFNFTPPATTFEPEPVPGVVLTVQSALPGTLLADGSSIPNPGQPVIIKLNNRGNNPPSMAATLAGGLTQEDFGGAGFLAGVDNGVDPTTDSLIDVGNLSQMRFLGIGGNQTTGQQRIPVIITSIYDDTVGTTVRGQKLFTAIDGNTRAPQPGDGGLIYFGGNMLHDYNVLDPRAGSIIDNADIRYISRIELQGGGVLDWVDRDASNAFDAGDNPTATKGGAFRPNPLTGLPDPDTYAIQGNTENALMISNSNLSNFSDAGVYQHRGFNAIAGGRSSISGQAALLVMMNNTVANMPIGVQVIGDANPDAAFPTAYEFLALNNTFYNNPLGVDLQAIAWAPGTPQTRSSIHFVAMDNIFQGPGTAGSIAVQGAGMLDGSQMQYNIFHNYATLFAVGAVAVHNGLQNQHAILADPLMIDPANGNFQLQPNSPAIDASRSELQLFPSSAPDAYSGVISALLPVVDQQLIADPANPLYGVSGIRNQTTRVPEFAQLDPNDPPTDLLTLPGYSDRGFVDLWVPTLATDPQGLPGPTYVPGSWVYKPALIPSGTTGVPGGGERDGRGYLRIDDPNRPNVGFGSRPFFDIGAFEYVKLYPPHVTDVKATVTDPAAPGGASTVGLYTVGGVSGTNKPIRTIDVLLDHNLDPNTVNGSTVLLQASGGDSIFGNNNNPNDKFYNLSGKVFFNATTNVLTINVGAAGLSLQNDMYRLFLVGTGSDVIRDPQGNALDGENTVNGDPNGAQLALPSGDGFPGGNFYTTFVVNTAAPQVVPGSLQLAPTSDSNVTGDYITKVNLPAFIGTASVGVNAITPLAGLTVYLDISTKGDGVFDRLNAGTAQTNAQGGFSVQVGVDAAGTGLVTDSSPLPDTSWFFDPVARRFVDYSFARVRIVDQSGNASNNVNDSLASFNANNATTNFIVDTAAPKITSFYPTPNTTLQPNPASGYIYFQFTTDSYVDPASLNANSILVTRAGADGALGTADDVSVPIAANSIASQFIQGQYKGQQLVSFLVSASVPNDTYAVTLKGTGSTPIIDAAGNALAGAFNGTFPSGQDDVAGVDFNPVYVVFNPAQRKNLFVGASLSLTPDGSRANPYQTITAALAAATAGDRVAVLPGVYTESITLKPFVAIASAASSSTDTNFVPGVAQQTVLRAPTQPISSGPPIVYATVTASNLPRANGIDTEISGLTIATPLLGDPALGAIDPSGRAIQVTNSDIVIDDNYIIDSQIGVNIVTSGDNALSPRVYNNGIIGNVNGIVLDDSGTTTSLATSAQIVNNTIGFNTIGVLASNTNSTPIQATIQNNIIWQNHTLGAGRTGTGISSATLNKLVARNNLFSGNGTSDTSPADDAVNVGNGLDPSKLSATPDGLGNYTGNPAFVSPRDPRPNGDGPGRFFLDANFDLTSASAAIDAALNSVAPATDFLHRGRVDISGKGFPGTGPADVGAFEYTPAAGSVNPGPFRISGTSLSTDGSGMANGATFTAQTAPKSITVYFSTPVDKSTVSAADLVLSGSGLKPVGGARATSVTWVDAQTARFNLAGGYNSSGSVKVSVAAGSIKSSGKGSIAAFSDSFRIGSSISGAATTQSLTPAPAASPTTPQGPRFRLSRLVGK